MTASPNGEARQADASPATSSLHIVGIGASSGGFVALQRLLGSLPPEPGFACVIVVHLSPEHESHMAELLQPHTAMPVQQVTSTVALEANHVYVIPPNANLDTIDTHLRLSELEKRRVERAPIDHFLRTLAATHGGTAIGVVLTGAGSDGSIGLRHIKECGGLTIAQDPHEAQFDSMPRSAIATGSVDQVLPLNRIGEAIRQFCNTRPQLPGEGEMSAQDRESLTQILGAVRKRTHQNFEVFRRGTLLKRLRRRMQLQQIMTMADYHRHLVQHPEEADALASEMHVTPTEFFAHEPLFEELEKHILPEILARKNREDNRLRIWSIGCATGEEAYSLGMLLAESSAQYPYLVQSQVFASDASEKLLNFGRQGLYPKEIATSVSPERLQRFFSEDAGFFHVKRDLRDRVLFATHDLFKDPPFAHIDLIICRTLLSDLQPEVRQGVLGLLHYALELDGFLLVGPGDEVNIPGLIEVETRSVRLFRKVALSSRNPRLPAYLNAFGPGGIRGAHSRPNATSPARAAAMSVYWSELESYVPPNVLINADNDVVYFSSNAAQYLRIPGGTLTHDLTRLFNEPLRSHLLEALGMLQQGAGGWNSPQLTVRTDHGPRQMILRLKQLQTGLTLVVMDDRHSAPQVEASAVDMLSPAPAEPRVESSAIETVEAEAHRIDAANEELRSVQEELANSREELQALSEELFTLEQENHRRVHELTQVSMDLHHLLAATGIATLFLDRDLLIVRSTPLLGELFGLRLSDVGRPVADLTLLARYEGLEADAREVLQNLQPLERELAGEQGRWYLGRLLPYRLESGRVEGVVLSLIDITERKRAEQALMSANRNKDQFLAVLAHELRNPLAPISAGVEILKTAPHDRALVARTSETMARQIKQLVRLVEDLLEVSRISGGKLQLRTAPLDLREVIQDAIAGAQASIEGAGHTIAVNLPAEAVCVNGDAARLVQVLSNLLNNAVRYTPRPGKLSVTAAREGTQVVISVKDTGVGISGDALESVFQMFYQGRDGTQRGAGLGIGLTLAQTLVEMHGGTISAHSEGEDQGSEFKIRLPLAVSVEQPTGKSVSPESNGASVPISHRILIVDDNVDAAETLCTLMKSLGQEAVYTASSAAQALQSAPELHPDIVLLDLMMPEMDGFELARRIRGESWGKELLLVALSGWGHEEHRRRTKAAGFDQHVTKPADIAAIRAVLRETRHQA